MRSEHVVAIRDRGPGFPPGSDERIFEKFFRGAQGTQGVAGAGLGLAITRGIVEAHGGRAEARARAGGGAEILLHFPIVGAPPIGQLPQMATPLGTPEPPKLAEPS
jgi:two-component system sensor histidine kinase KdpD